MLSLESRRSREIARLIENHGGKALVVPAVREVPIDPPDSGRAFATELLGGRVDGMIFLTGVGTRALLESAKPFCDSAALLGALRKLPIVARSSKPASALRDLEIPIALLAPEPNTWHEVLRAIDDHPSAFPLRDRRIAIQEHGERSDQLHAGLTERGARTLSVEVYRWALPEDTAALQSAVTELTAGQIDVVLFTAAVQVSNLLAVADTMHQRTETLRALQQSVVGSIGPVASAELRRQGVDIAIEPEHPKMGSLIHAAAERVHLHLRRP